MADTKVAIPQQLNVNQQRTLLQNPEARAAYVLALKRRIDAAKAKQKAEKEKAEKAEAKQQQGLVEQLGKELLAIPNVRVLREVLISLNELYLENDDKQLYLRALVELFGAAVAQRNRVLFTALLTSNVDIASAIVEWYPESFSAVSPVLQRSVYRVLANKPQPQEAAVAPVMQLQVSDGKEEVKQEHKLSPIESINAAMEAKAKDLGDQKRDIERVKTAIAERNTSGANKTVAQRIINEYLATKPNQYKNKFFADLSEAISNHGITIAQLQSSLETADHAQLFASRSGPMKSGAARCFRRLYDLASLGRGLSEREYKTLVSSDQKHIFTLPTLDKLIASTVEDELKGTLLPRLDGVYQITHGLLGREVNAIRVCHQETQARQRARVEAIYQQHVLRKATDQLARQLSNKPPTLILDTQARALVTYVLTPEDYAVMVDRIGPDAQAQEKAKNGIAYDQSDLMRLAGFPLLPEHKEYEHTEFAPEAFCTIDIGNDAVFQKYRDAYGQWLGIQVSQVHMDAAEIYGSDIQALGGGEGLYLPEEHKDEKEHLIQFSAPSEMKVAADAPQSRLNQAHEAFMQLHSRDSVIPLQLEMFDHVRVMLNGLMQRVSLDKSAKQKLKQSILAEVAATINVKVRDVFKQALLDSFKSGTIDIAKLNRRLDKARKPLAAYSRNALIAASVNIFDGNEEYQQKFNTALSELDRHDFPMQPATTADILGTSNQSNGGVCCRVTGTAYTAHGKALGAANQATRFIYQNRLEWRVNESGLTLTVTPPSSGLSVRARTPSLAPFSADDSYPPDTTDDAMVVDVTAKIGHAVRRFNTNGPYIYQLMTSFAGVGRSIAGGQHKQTKSAEIILRAAHDFNTAQAVTYHNINDLFLPFGIPTNEHTTAVKRDSIYSVIAEDALMAELAVLAVLAQNAHHLPLNWRDYIHEGNTEVRGQYVQFLQQRAASHWVYFKDSPMGERTNRWLDGLHTDYTNGLSMAVSNQQPSLPELATRALLKIFARNNHLDEQYGRLVQALMMFLAPDSFAGCKSANERWLTVAGRMYALVEMDQNMQTNQLSETERTLKDALMQFVQDDGMFSSPSRIDTALDRLYDEQTVCNPLYAVTTQDQGAGPKVGSWKNWFPKSTAARISCILIVTWMLWAIYSWLNTNNADSSNVKTQETDHASAMQAHKMDKNFVTEWRVGVDAYKNSPLGKQHKAARDKETMHGQLAENALLIGHANRSDNIDIPGVTASSSDVAASSFGATGPRERQLQGAFNSLRDDGSGSIGVPSTPSDDQRNVLSL